MRHKKLLISFMALAVVLVALLTQPTLAYYSVLGTATNVVTSGEIKCKIIEKMGDEDFPAEGVYVKPGSIVSKKVSVKNIGENPFWLRVKLTNTMDDTDLFPDIFELDINDVNWISGDDGYYYYNKILQPGAETENLFTQVKIPENIGGQYLGKTIHLKVTAYAVQSEYNSPDEPTQVVGWPMEP